MKTLGMKLAIVSVALLLVAGAPLAAVAKVVDDPAATGKVTTYEAGKVIALQVGDDKKEFKITEETKIEGELAVGKEVQVWAKDGSATLIKVKE